MELKEIPTEKILANFYQPRTKFDKDKIQELAESILSNGLINPITVRTWKDKFMIVSGERRWRAHKLANIKTIQAFVKDYSDEGKFMVESLIENIHREDLSPTEKGKFCLQIKKQMKLENNEQVANVIKVPEVSVNDWIDDFQFRQSSKRVSKDTSHTLLRSTKGLDNKERENIIKYAEKEGIAARKIEEQFMPVYKKSDEPTRKALLSGRITVEEAKKGNVPEPIQLERTANDIADDILSNLDNFRHNVDELKECNLQDLSMKWANQGMTTAGVFMKSFIGFINILKQRGAKPNPLIMALIKASGKL